MAMATAIRKLDTVARGATPRRNGITHGEAASAKVQTVTHACYDGILKAYTPASYHGRNPAVEAAVALG